jgi:hypothetical protein
MAGSLFTNTDFQAADWYRALTLTERIATLRKSRASDPEAIMRDQAGNRREKWQAEFQAAGAGKNAAAAKPSFDQRLDMDGITKDEWSVLLAQTDEMLRDRILEMPAWLEDLAHAFLHSKPSQPFPQPPSGSGNEMNSFLEAVAPLIETGRCRLRAAIDALVANFAVIPFDPCAVEKLLFPYLQNRLLLMLSRTMALEMNLARWRGQLEGDTGAQRFRSFIRRLQTREFSLALLKEYPVLARQAVECIEQWSAFGSAFLAHLCADWKTMQNMFSPKGEPGALTEILWGAGDSHCGGKSVLIAGFNSGWRVVYKPRSLAWIFISRNCWHGSIPV